MKKTFLFFLIAFCMSLGSLKAQVDGSDYVILLDNGSSIDKPTFEEMKLGATKLIEKLLTCNPRNRVSVVHYGAGKYEASDPFSSPVIYIESDFTNNYNHAQYFERRLYFGDYFHETLGLVRDALNGNNNPNIISSQTTLDNDLSRRLIFVTFTDAERNSGSSTWDESYWVNYSYPAFNSDGAFKNVIDFKSNRDAKFATIHFTPTSNANAINAAAVITSSGSGPYAGTLENYPGDPDAGMLPRLYYNRTNGFGLYSQEVDYWGDIAANICDSTGWGTVKFQYEPGYCYSNPAIINGTYNLPLGAVLNGFKLEIFNPTAMTSYPVSFTPTYGLGTFSYQLQGSDFNFATGGGAYGMFKLKVIMVYTYQGVTYYAESWNNYPWFDTDIDMGCAYKMAPTSVEKPTLFKLTPNPTDGLFKVILDKNITAGTLQVMNVSGNIVYNKAFRGEKELEINIHSQNQGIYIVKVVSDKNEVYTEKLIKK